jgi:maltokinase
MDSTISCLAAWMPRQRWYAGKGRAPHLAIIGSWDLPAPGPGVVVRTYLVADESALPVVLYQVPVVARATADIEPDAVHVIGDPEPGTTLVDGPHDPAYANALLTLITTGTGADGSGARAQGFPAAAAAPVATMRSAVLAGEQSNTSIVYRPAEGTAAPIICKVFRQLHGGRNPDIELQTALASAGSGHVPPAIGSIEGSWPDPMGGGAQEGSLAFAQEFLPGVEDAWRVALLAASSGEDFTERAEQLGVATAEVHLLLARLFPPHEASEQDRAAARATWDRRLVTAVSEVPGIAARGAEIEAVYDRALQHPWPALQRVHGDYHLGQVILVPGRGWVLLDFEGEPLRPMAERTRPDLALRDVAGMLRSFDYVGGSIRLDRPDHSVDEVGDWVTAARAAFLRGYAGAADVDLAEMTDLLNALELDKAVYEVIYETRNRPTWTSIPRSAIGRIIDRPGARSG